MNTYEANKLALEDALKSFPSTFGLRAFPGRLFRLSPASSYHDGERVMLYVYVEQPDGEWVAFSKGTPEEVRAQIIPWTAEI